MIFLKSWVELVSIIKIEEELKLIVTLSKDEDYFRLIKQPKFIDGNLIYFTPILEHTNLINISGNEIEINFNKEFIDKGNQSNNFPLKFTMNSPISQFL